MHSYGEHSRVERAVCSLISKGKPSTKQTEELRFLNALILLRKQKYVSLQQNGVTVLWTARLLSGGRKTG